eukprot:1502583-Prymnesium_polylepis.1
MNSASGLLALEVLICLGSKKSTIYGSLHGAAVTAGAPELELDQRTSCIVEPRARRTHKEGRRFLGRPPEHPGRVPGANPPGTQNRAQGRA